MIMVVANKSNTKVYIFIYILFVYICNRIIENLSKYSYVFPQKECIMPQKSTTHTAGPAGPAGDDSIAP